jgi:hypothetical protein
MRAAAICLDGVLRKPLDVEAQDFGASYLYGALTSEFRVIVLGTEDSARDEHFLLINGMDRHAELEPEDPADGPERSQRILGQLRRLRARGFQFEFVVVPDPQSAVDMYRRGYPVLLYLHPQYSDNRFRPDYAGGIKPWDELVSEVEQAQQWAVRKRKAGADGGS